MLQPQDNRQAHRQFLTGSIYRPPEPTTGLSASPECDRFSRHAARLLIEVNHGCPVVLFGSATIGLFYNWNNKIYHYGNSENKIPCILFLHERGRIVLPGDSQPGAQTNFHRLQAVSARMGCGMQRNRFPFRHRGNAPELSGFIKKCRVRRLQAVERDYLTPRTFERHLYGGWRSGWIPLTGRRLLLHRLCLESRRAAETDR